MNEQHQDVIKSLLQECSRLDQNKKQSRRYSKEFKNNLKFLYTQGYSKKELVKLIPVSIFSIEQWTQDISPPSFRKIKISENKKIIKSDNLVDNSKLLNQIIFNQRLIMFLLILLLAEMISLH